MIGTAPVTDGTLLIEWPTAWPHDVDAIAELVEVVTAARAVGVRVQLVRRVLPGTERAIVLYRRADVSFDRFNRIETAAEPEAVASTALGLLERPLAVDASPAVVDVLVCSHGTRDVCCGSGGTRLALDVHDTLAEAGIHVWRTSHLGGHRFAPTALLLPTGTMWGRLDPPTLTGVARRELDPAHAARHLRGTIALAAPLQVIERAAFESTGWKWFDRRREGWIDGSEATLVSEAPGARESWSGAVAARRLVPVPPCGQSPGAHDKTEPELELCGRILRIDMQHDMQ